MATATLYKVSPKVILDVGTSAAGNVKTATVNYATFANTTMTDDAAYSIASAINPVLSSSVYAIRIDKQYNLEE